MGKQQTAFIQGISSKETACYKSVNAIRTGCGKVLDLNQQIEATNDAAKKKQLSANKNPFYLDLLKANRELTPLLDAFSKSIPPFETFVTNKKKRWRGKSTLPEAEAFLKAAKTQKQNFTDLLAASKLLT